MKLYWKNDENSATVDNDNEIQELKNKNIELKKTIDKMSHGIKSTGLRSSLVGNDSYYVRRYHHYQNHQIYHHQTKHNIPAPVGVAKTTQKKTKQKKTELEF